MLRDDNPFGLSLAIAANAFFVLNSGLSHFAVGQGYSVEEILLVGCFVKWLLAHWHLRLQQQVYDIKWDQETGLVLACQLFNTPSYFLFMLALGYISIRFAMILENLGPFIVACFSYICLKERTSLVELINMLVCFAVVLAIIIMGGEQDDHSEAGVYQLLIGSALTLVSLVMFSGTYVINRFLRNCDPVILNAQNMLYSLFIAILLFVLRSDHYIVSMSGLYLGSLNGILGFFCSLFFIKASQMQPASRVAALDFCQVPMGFILDRFVFGQAIGLVEILGCLFICASGVFVFTVAYKEQSAFQSDASTGDLETPLISQSVEIYAEEQDKYFKISIPRYSSERLKNTQSEEYHRL